MTRDEQLGSALRELRVPDHAPEFAARLRAGLEEGSVGAPAQVEGAAAARRARRRREAAGAPAPPAPRRGRRRRRPPLLAGLGVAGVLAAVALALVLLAPDGTQTPGGGRLGAEPATAAQLGARLTSTLATVDTLSAILVVRERPSPDLPLRTTRSRLLLSSSGDERLTTIGDGPDSGYDASAGRQTVFGDPDVPQTGGTVTTGMAPGPPDRPLGDRAIQRQLRGVARALRAAGAAPVRAVTYDGRPAWRIAIGAEQDVHALPGDTGDRIELVIDRRTGIPLLVRETYRGRLVAQRRLEDVRIDPPLEPRAFVPRPADPSGIVATMNFTQGFRPRAFDRAERVVGYAPLEPAWLPAGFRRAETAVALRTPSPTGAEGMNPPSHDVVSTAYRRGLDTVVVSTRSAGIDAKAWDDPVAAPEGFLVRPQRACFRSGALKGACGELMVDPRATTHVWTIAGGLVVTVSGDLTQGELERVAASLRRAG